MRLSLVPNGRLQIDLDLKLFCRSLPFVCSFVHLFVSHFQILDSRLYICFGMKFCLPEKEGESGRERKFCDQRIHQLKRVHSERPWCRYLGRAISGSLPDRIIIIIIIIVSIAIVWPSVWCARKSWPLGLQDTQTNKSGAPSICK